MKNKTSRIPRFYNLSINERLNIIKDFCDLTEQEYDLLKRGGGINIDEANRMIENVISTYNLPYSIAVNFLINNKEYLIPMVIEEPSVVAALSLSAKIIRDNGGFTSIYSGSITTGQIQIGNIKDLYNAKFEILKNKEKIIEIANNCDPVLISVGGGVKDIDVRVFEEDRQMVVVYLYVDTKDAMGANAVNTMCEGVADYIEKITGGKIYLRILTNLSDRRIVRSKCKINKESLSFENFSGKEVVNGIIKAYEFAKIDSYRAATHNKGIMNGIDAVLIATGNDWRAEEAACHAYACRTGKYLPLTVWEKDSEGNLIGYIEIPALFGIVGGCIKTHPLAKLSLKIMNISNVQEFAEIIGAVGLGQNFAALRALSTQGIQKGHMKLHARNIAVLAGIEDEYIDRVVNIMINEGKIRIDIAKKIYENLKKGGLIKNEF